MSREAESYPAGCAVRSQVSIYVDNYPDARSVHLIDGQTLIVYAPGGPVIYGPHNWLTVTPLHPAVPLTKETP